MCASPLSTSPPSSAGGRLFGNWKRSKSPPPPSTASSTLASRRRSGDDAIRPTPQQLSRWPSFLSSLDGSQQHLAAGGASSSSSSTATAAPLPAPKPHDSHYQHSQPQQSLQQRLSPISRLTSRQSRVSFAGSSSHSDKSVSHVSSTGHESGEGVPLPAARSTVSFFEPERETVTFLLEDSGDGRMTESPTLDQNPTHGTSTRSISSGGGLFRVSRLSLDGLATRPKHLGHRAKEASRDCVVQ